MRTSQWEKALLAGEYDKQLEKIYGDADGAKARLLPLLNAHREQFGDGDAAVISAPGRTELAGNHTDHQNGRVLCAAVTLDALAVVSPAEDDRAVICSDGFGRIEASLSTAEPRADEAGTSESILRGVAAGFLRRGLRVGGFRASLTSLVPAGGGLSSSAAFENLVGGILSHFYNGGAVDPMTLAQISQGAETEFFGKPCGLMDQAASACGGITMIDFADPAAPAVDRIDFDFRSAGYVLCAVDTRTSHADLTGDYASIPRDMCAVANALGCRRLRQADPAALADGAVRARLERELSPLAVLRAKHFFEENERVPLMADALRRGDVGEYARLMNLSGRSSREQLQNVVPTCHPDRREMAEALDRAGALLGDRGAWRIHGGGFAGCIQCLVPAEDYPDFAAAMDGFYGKGACFELRIRPCGVHVL